MDEQPFEQFDAAPLPTARTLRMRRSVPVQLLRFAAINLRMLRVIARGHR